MRSSWLVAVVVAVCCGCRSAADDECRAALEAVRQAKALAADPHDEPFDERWDNVLLSRLDAATSSPSSECKEVKRLIEGVLRGRASGSDGAEMTLGVAQAYDPDGLCRYFRAAWEATLQGELPSRGTFSDGVFSCTGTFCSSVAVSNAAWPTASRWLQRFDCLAGPWEVGKKKPVDAKVCGHPIDRRTQRIPHLWGETRLHDGDCANGYSQLGHSIVARQVEQPSGGWRIEACLQRHQSHPHLVARNPRMKRETARFCWDQYRAAPETLAFDHGEVPAPLDVIDEIELGCGQPRCVFPVGQPIELRANGRRGAGAALRSVEATWIVDEPSIVRLLPPAGAVGLAPGAATLTARTGAVEAQLRVIIEPPADRLVVECSDPHFAVSSVEGERGDRACNVALLGTAKLIARAFSGDYELSAPALSWRSTDPSVVTVDDGVLAGKMEGGAIVAAELGATTVIVPVIVAAPRPDAPRRASSQPRKCTGERSIFVTASWTIKNWKGPRVVRLKTCGCTQDFGDRVKAGFDCDSHYAAACLKTKLLTHVEDWGDSRVDGIAKGCCCNKRLKRRAG